MVFFCFDKIVDFSFESKFLLTKLVKIIEFLKIKNFKGIYFWVLLCYTNNIFIDYKREK